eukprot:TRINITY_DN1942_c0_g1_i1.p1 TRINITY_DN1942_c0_g1~~TRINITY_DN1942_c0_g1_i1.p1  ORF type:complete len:87 (+),score=14.40 TRINITY_DN1942_c0_g1_i1:25-261(+)
MCSAKLFPTLVGLANARQHTAPTSQASSTEGGKMTQYHSPPQREVLRPGVNSQPATPLQGIVNTPQFGGVWGGLTPPL